MNFFHSGDLGDAIYALPSVRSLGGGRIYFADRPWTRSRWTPQLFSQIKPLFDATDYCTAYLHDGEEIDIDISTFRHGGYKLGDTIVERQRRWIGAPEGGHNEPWLEAEANSLAKVVISRASRWHGFHFPWKAILEAFDTEMVFLGLREEHAAFEKEFGRVMFIPCPDLLKAAQIIAGAEVFIGNQSACAAIANGLHKNLVLEVCAFAPDCFLRQENAFYSFNGEAKFSAGGKNFEAPSYDGKFRTKVGERILSSDDMDKLRVIARSVHAYNGSFAFYEEVQVA